MQRIVSDRMRGGKGDLSNERATLETAYAMIDQRMASPPSSAT
jgi:glutathione S-transferase